MDFLKLLSNSFDPSQNGLSNAIDPNNNGYSNAFDPTKNELVTKIFTNLILASITQLPNNSNTFKSFLNLKI